MSFQRLYVDPGQHEHTYFQKRTNKAKNKVSVHIHQGDQDCSVQRISFKILILFI